MTSDLLALLPPQALRYTHINTLIDTPKYTFPVALSSNAYCSHIAEGICQKCNKAFIKV
jgi:hypothetical protein